MTYYPIFLNLNQRQVVVVGGGAVAERKVESLLLCGASVIVVSPEVTRDLESLVASGTIALRRRHYESDDCANAFVVIAATDDVALQARIWHDARNAGALVNTVDNPDRCDFIVPAVTRHGDITVAVSTNGQSPTLAARLRDTISGVIHSEYGQLVDLLGRIRPEVRRRIPSFDRRKVFYSRILDEPVRTEQRVRSILEEFDS